MFVHVADSSQGVKVVHSSISERKFNQSKLWLSNRFYQRSFISESNETFETEDRRSSFINGRLMKITFDWEIVIWIKSVQIIDLYLRKYVHLQRIHHHKHKCRSQLNLCMMHFDDRDQWNIHQHLSETVKVIDMKLIFC